MSLVSEERRQAEIKERTAQLTAADRYRQRTEERQVANLAKNAEANTLADIQRKEAMERERFENLGLVDEYQRLKADADFLRLADWLQIDAKQLDDARSEMLFIMNWAKDNAKIKDMVGILGYLKRTKSNLGFKEVGFTGLKKFYQYARLEMDEKRIEREKRLLKE